MNINESTPDPKDGSIGRNPDGTLNGFLYEKAWKFINEARPNPSFPDQVPLVKDAIDEAHHLTEHSAEYHLARQLSAKTTGLMLLTATPEQLGVRSHFARLQLLDPARYYNFSVFEKEEEDYQSIADIINKLLDDRRISNNDIKMLDKILPNKFEKDLAVSLQKD